MKKNERRGVRNMRIKLSNFEKLTRKGERVAVMCGIKGVTILCYIFTPGDKRRDKKKAIKDLGRLLWRLNPDVIYVRRFREYPDDLFIDLMSTPETRPYIKFSYAPHKLWFIISQNPKAQDNGRILGPVLDEFGGNERSFRAALAVLIREKLIVVTRNGFVWLRSVAEEKIGVSLDVTAKEIYQ